MLRGAKSIGDRADLGMIVLEVTQEDQEALKDIVIKNGFEMPLLKIAIYKNRRGRYKDVLLWCKADRGICRIDPIFCTDYSYKIINIPDLQIQVTDRKEESAF